MGYFLVQLLDINFGLYLHSSSYPQNWNNKNSREKEIFLTYQGVAAQLLLFQSYFADIWFSLSFWFWPKNKTRNQKNKIVAANFFFLIWNIWDQTLQTMSKCHFHFKIFFLLTKIIVGGSYKNRFVNWFNFKDNKCFGLTSKKLNFNKIN